MKKWRYYGAEFVRYGAIGLIAIGILGVLLYGLMTLILELAVVSTGFNETQGSLVVLICAIYTAISIFSIITGIYGVKKCNDPKNAKTCLVLGLIALVLYAISDIWMSVGPDQKATLIHSIYASITGIATGFYAWGAYYMLRFGSGE